MNRLSLAEESPSLVVNQDVKYLEVILKTAERCNLNCSYCYFFNLSDQSYKSHPAFVHQNTIQDLIQFLKRSKEACPNLEHVRIDFHGGEPMLQPKHQFDAMCQNLKEALQGYFELHFCMQTNATLVNPEWIKLLEKHRVSVSISLDGPEAIHDEFRVDHRGQGSYKKTIQGLELLQRADINGIVGVLCVINPAHDPALLCRHFIHDLGIKFMDFLIPDYTHDSFPFHKYKVEEYGNYLCTLFDVWVAEDDPSVTIRFLSSIVAVMLGKPPMLYGIGAAEKGHAVITISSNGDVGPADPLRNTDPTLMSRLGSIKNLDLAQILDSPFIRNLNVSLDTLPEGCRTCCWQHQCRGGDSLSRYSKKTQFENPSVFCSALKMIYAKVAQHLLRNGENAETILKHLKI